VKSKATAVYDDDDGVMSGCSVRLRREMTTRVTGLPVILRCFLSTLVTTTMIYRACGHVL